MVLLICVIRLLFSFPAVADEQTLVRRNSDSGGYGGLGFKLTYLDQQLCHVVGFRAGWIVNHLLLLGAGGYGNFQGITREIALIPTDLPAPYRLSITYAGLDLGMVFFSDRAVHFGFQSLIGAGHAGYINTTEATHFFVIETSLFSELNIVDWFRVCIGGGYRLAYAGYVIQGMDEKSLHGPSLDILFKVGRF